MRGMGTLRLFDAHNHLQEFAGRADFARMVDEARKVGVERMVVNGTRESDWPAVARLANEWPELVVPAFGLHPWHVASRTPGWLKTLEARLREFPHAAVGEIGLDRWVRDFDWDAQTAVFAEQWRLAVALNRPAQVHCLRAYGHLEQMLRDERKPERGWLLHNYGGPAEMVPAFAALGASFSFSGYFLTARKIADRTAAFTRVPGDRLLLETDAPDMAPPEEFSRFSCFPREGGGPANHPGNLAGVCEGLARVLGVSPEALAARTTANAARMFLGDAG